MTHSQEIVDSLRKQYTLNNDGAGLDGRCRVSNKDLLELLRLVEQTEQQNAELKEQSSRLANESVRQAQQNADLCVKNAELQSAYEKSAWDCDVAHKRVYEAEQQNASLLDSHARLLDAMKEISGSICDNTDYISKMVYDLASEAIAKAGK